MMRALDTAAKIAHCNPGLSSVHLYSMSQLVAPRFPDDILDVVFADGAQVFSETSPTEACETASELASRPVFDQLNSSAVDKAGVNF